MARQMGATRLVAISLCVAGVVCSGRLDVPTSDEKEPSSLALPSRLRRTSSSRKRAELTDWQPAWGGVEDSNWKRAPNGLGSAGFHSNVFSHGFGTFSPVKRIAALMKRRPEMDSSGFYGDTFNGGMGYFDTMKKRRPEMDSSGFYGDTFNGGMGYFDTMKKRRPEMDSSGFYGDTFNGGMGYFDTMKKRRPEMDSSGFYGDTFNGGMGYFDTMKRKLASKRRPEMDGSGFHGDVFSNGFGYFDTMKRRASKAAQAEEDSPAGSDRAKFEPLKDLQSHKSQTKMADEEQDGEQKIQDGRFFGARVSELNAAR